MVSSDLELEGSVIIWVLVADESSSDFIYDGCLEGCVRYARIYSD